MKLSIFSRTYIITYIHTYTNTYVHCIYTYIYTYIHIHTHTHIQALGFNCIEAVIFSWIFITSIIWAYILPGHSCEELPYTHMYATIYVHVYMCVIFLTSITWTYILPEYIHTYSQNTRLKSFCYMYARRCICMYMDGHTYFQDVLI